MSSQMIFFLIIASPAPNFAASATTGGPPKGLMIQLSTWSYGTKALTDWMTYICQYHRDPTKPGYIVDLVIQDTAVADPNASVLQNPPVANDTMMFDKIDALLPYFPGGSSNCRFDNVFVGTVDLQGAMPPGVPAEWTSYREGMKNGNFRWNLLRRSLAVAQKLKSHIDASNNPNVIYHWYISQEAMLNWFTDSDLEDCYFAYMNQHIQYLSSVVTNRAFLWSPGFDQLPADFPPQSTQQVQLQKNLANFFSRIPPAVLPYNPYGQGRGGPLWLNLQDHVGSTQNFPHPMKKEDAKQWFYFLKGLANFTSLSMNVEQFRHGANNWQELVGCDPTEIVERENYYQQEGIPLGPAWELRFWGDNNHT